MVLISSGLRSLIYVTNRPHATADADKLTTILQTGAPDFAYGWPPSPRQKGCSSVVFNRDILFILISSQLRFPVSVPKKSLVGRRGTIGLGERVRSVALMGCLREVLVAVLLL